MERVCKRCLIAGQAEDYVRLIEENLALVPAREQPSEEEYARRIGLCRSCGYLSGATCRACGCYVELRAMKARIHCPYGKW